MLGFINLLKPAGPSSTQFGARLRRIYGEPGKAKLAVGHLGTLDPQAAGVLPIALGRATRLIPLIEDRRKAYAFTLRLGRSTHSGDATGETVTTALVPDDAPERLAGVLERFLGKVEQIPPMVSALKHEGQRLYDLARAGQVVERKPRTITIYGLSIGGVEDAMTIRMRVACSEGTYVRTLCEDLASAIGTVGHMGALLREASGPFLLYESRTLDEIEADPDAALIPPERIISIPTIVLDGRLATDFRAGRIVAMSATVGDTHVFVRDPSRALIGVGEMHGTMLAPRKVFV